VKTGTEALVYNQRKMKQSTARTCTSPATLRTEVTTRERPFLKSVYTGSCFPFSVRATCTESAEVRQSIVRKPQASLRTLKGRSAGVDPALAIQPCAGTSTALGSHRSGSGCAAALGVKPFLAQVAGWPRRRFSCLLLATRVACAKRSTKGNARCMMQEILIKCPQRYPGCDLLARWTEVDSSKYKSCPLIPLNPLNPLNPQSTNHARNPASASSMLASVIYLQCCTC